MSIKEALHAQRKVLLDLTYRNRLLNLPSRPSTRSIVVHGERSAEIYDLLVLAKKALAFEALPSGEAEEVLPAHELTGASDHAVVLDQPDIQEPAQRTGTRLRTRLKSDHLQKRLLEIFYESRTMLEEQGVNILYLALGQLRFFDPAKPDDIRSAPLLLLPVQLERKTARDRFVLRWSEEDLQENISLREKLRADFGIQLPEFPLGDTFDVPAYFAQLEEALDAQQGWSVVEDAIQLGFFSFAKFLMYLDLDPANWPVDREIDRHPLVEGLLGDGIPTEEAPVHDSGPAYLDALLPVDRLQYVVDCDSSQALAIEAVRRGENLVIQGPPGTGKSQTIANVVATAVADGKTVLFVAEKMAALEVVKRRLENVGLGPLCLELHSNKANKKIVLEELARTLRVTPPESLDVQAVVSRLAALRDTLNRHAIDLHRADIGTAGLSAFEIIGNLVKRLPEAGQPSYRLEEAPAWSREQVADKAALLGEVCQHLAIVGPPSRNIWRGVDIAPVMRPAAEDLLHAVHGLPDRLGAVLSAAASLAGVLELPAPTTIESVQAQCDMARQLVRAPAFDRRTINSAVWSAGVEALRDAIANGKQLAQLRRRRAAEVVEAAWDIDWQPARMAIAAHGDSWLRWLNRDHRSAVAQLRGVARSTPPKGRAARLTLLDDLISARRCATRLAETREQAKAAFGTVWSDEHTDWDLAESVLGWVTEQGARDAGPTIRELAALVEDRDALASALLAAERALEAQRDLEAVLKARLGYQEAQATEGGTLAKADLHELRERFLAWRGRGEDLIRWLAYNDVRRRATEAGLAEAMASFVGEPECWPVAVGQFWNAYYLRMLEQAQAQYSDLARFDGRRHDELVAEFRKLDTTRLQVAQYEAAQAHYESVPRSSIGGVGALGTLRGEIARKRGHMALRKLLRLCASPIQAAKPVFMMSPLSVAQYLEPGGIEFDLLVIDEASQVEPVDAIGAIARSRKMVVVGDDKQLPPTSFFSRIVESDDLDDVDEGAQARDLESILSLCVAKGLPQRMLQWHYRSRHESLIAVSNKEFYEGNLFIVPSPDRARAGLGLKFHHLPHGRFDRGNSQKNHVEATAIAQAVVTHARERPHLTLGVGAMSVRQRQAILDEVELARRQHPELEHFFASHPHEPFFIKNLENIQGDERDVILISIGYGRAKSDDKMYQSFGPLNADGGHRRLNVLITRARMLCEVYSSIVADDIRIDSRSKPGLVALKSFLRYAELGDLGIPVFTGRGVDSPFEEAVQAVLTRSGYQVDNQVGVAGFFIDLAVVDPDVPGRYLIGIECDGAAYHSAPSARDRDRLRQDILEAHGWTIHRIWSTDWFQQEAKETARLLRAIEAAKAGGAEARKPTQEPVPIRRAEPAEEPEQAEVRISVPYVQASFAPEYSHLAPHEVPEDSMMRTVLRIIEQEGPIHQDEVVARVRDIWNLGRAGNRIQGAVVSALARALRSHPLEMEALSYHVKGRPVMVRDRSEAESRSLKKPELLPPQEIRAALLALARATHGVRRDEAIVAVSRMLGFAATSRQLRDVIDLQFDRLVTTGGLEEADGLFHATSDVQQDNQ